MALDVVIRGGTVVDGTGAPPVKADIGITSDRITTVGDVPASASESCKVIDATGLHISPGFIDVHSHADAALLNDGQHASGIMQGVTTEIISPDGLSLAPLSSKNYEMYRWYLSGILGWAPEGLDMSSIEASRKNYHGKTSCNVATFAGHGPIRLEAAGMNDVPLSGSKLDAAKDLLRESLEQGAVGFATGLSYYPNSWSDTEELCALMEVTRDFDRPMSIHLRNHNGDRAFEGGGVPEAIEVARRTGTKLHFEHYRTFIDSAGQIDKLMEPIDKAKADGVDITLETYPYPVGSSFPQAFFPGYFHEGGPERMLNILNDEDKRAELISRMSEISYTGPEGNVWTHIGDGGDSNFEGWLFEDVAKEWAVSIEEMVTRMMAETSLACGMRVAPPGNVRQWRQVEEDVMQLIARPDYMVGSDSIPVGGMPHPRAYGCFVRMAGRLRRRHNYPLEQVVQRMTQNPAERFGLTGRGVIADGKFADLVIFDEQNINDRSSFEDPAVHPEGVPYVLVNGKFVVENEAVTGVMAGKAIP
ncbi:MAG: amidohydrolase family protein [Dehalococcoidia bacterium]|nr:amidohydrolase family protein [Dehalococcoidia bacterium]